MVKAQGRLSPRFAARKQDIRTRFYKLWIDGRQGSKEGNFIKDKLKIFLKEVKILQDQIKKLRGEDAYFKMPSVLEEEMVLLK